MKKIVCNVKKIVQLYAIRNRVCNVKKKTVQCGVVSNEIKSVCNVELNMWSRKYM